MITAWVPHLITKTMPKDWTGKISDFNLADRSMKKNSDEASEIKKRSQIAAEEKLRQRNKRKSLVRVDDIGNCFWPV